MKSCWQRFNLYLLVVLGYFAALFEMKSKNESARAELAGASVYFPPWQNTSTFLASRFEYSQDVAPLKSAAPEVLLKRC